jgi:hypothetical protein
MLSDPRAGLEEEYGQLERSRILDAILQELPPSLRSVVWLCDVEGLCMKEAAECLGLSVPAVKTRHLRAKRLILKVAKEVCPPAPILEMLTNGDWVALISMLTQAQQRVRVSR